MLDILKRNRVSELEKELATYKHAYETTRDDRNRIQADHERQRAALQWALDNPSLLAELPLPAMTGPFPQFVCVGAQKCATSFFYGVTREHPAVVTGAKDAGRTVAHEPVVYNANLIDQPNGLDQIAALNPDARILICTRDPVERAISEYKMRVREGRETRTFQDAIAANEQNGPFAYARRSQYAADIARFRDAFKHVLVLSADDDGKENLWRLFSFMGLRDLHALMLSACPPKEPSIISSAKAQTASANMTPEQRRLHDVILSDEERHGLHALLRSREAIHAGISDGTPRGIADSASSRVIQR